MKSFGLLNNVLYFSVREQPNRNLQDTDFIFKNVAELKNFIL